MIRIVALFSLLLLGFFMNAQIHGEVKWIEGKKYIYHQVKTQETLYGISKQYGVRISEILLANPEAIEGIKPEMMLVIPPVDKEDSEGQAELKGNLLYHEVKAQETMYGICQEYGVTEEDLRRVNDLSEGLKEGMSLIIPFEDELKGEEENAELEEETPQIKTGIIWESDSSKVDSFDLNVALILPLFLDQNDTIEISKKEDEDARLPKFTPISLQFMAGVYMALDSLKSKGHDIRMNVIDSEPDNLDFKEMLDSNSFSNYDLVIGPVKNNYFYHFLEKEDSGQYAILSPFNSDSSILKNPRVIKAVSNRQAEIDCMGDYLGKHKSASNIVFVYHSTTKPDYKEVEYLQKKMALSALNSGYDSLIRMPRRVNFRSVGLNGIVQNFTDTLENIVVVLSEDQSFVTSMMQKLEPFVEDFEIKIYGTSELSGYQSFEPELFKYLDVHVSSIGNLNLRDTMYLEFERDYFFRFGEIPSLHTVQAFEQTLFIGGQIAKHGHYYPGILDGKSYHGMFTDYYFKWSDANKGVENHKAFMIKFSDYQFIRINE